MCVFVFRERQTKKNTQIFVEHHSYIQTTSNKTVIKALQSVRKAVKNVGFVTIKRLFEIHHQTFKKKHAQ